MRIQVVTMVSNQHYLYRMTVLVAITSLAFVVSHETLYQIILPAVVSCASDKVNLQWVHVAMLRQVSCICFCVCLDSCHSIADRFGARFSTVCHLRVASTCYMRHLWVVCAPCGFVNYINSKAYDLADCLHPCDAGSKHQVQRSENAATIIDTCGATHHRANNKTVFAATA